MENDENTHLVDEDHEVLSDEESKHENHDMGSQSSVKSTTAPVEWKVHYQIRMN